MLVHGENDNDVPLSEAEQFYIALKDVGVETVFIRYPREGHGIRGVSHVIDWIQRSMRWHEQHFRGSMTASYLAGRYFGYRASRSSNHDATRSSAVMWISVRFRCERP
jgi:acetyl esterase/lipase